MLEPVIQDPDPDAGRLFWPISAAISLFGPLSLALSMMLPASILAVPFGDALKIAVLLFFVASLFTGTLGFVSILWGGLSTVGRLSVAGRTLEGSRLGVLYLLMHLPSFGIVFGTVLYTTPVRW